MLLDKFNLDKKTALITGASGLLGEQHASALLETGAKVILTDISKENLDFTKKTLGKIYNPSKIISEVMDVTDKKNIIYVSEKLIEQEIRIDILINNAAIDIKVDKEKNKKNNLHLENLSLREWNSQIDVGLKGAFLCSQIFGTQMALDKKGGVILNIASDLSVISPDQRLYEDPNISKESQFVKPITYSVIKTGLIGLTKYIATYWASDGVRCNALSPGGVLNNQDDKFIDRLNKLIPLARMAEKDEYRSTIQFLCSDASSYMNGQNIVVDGGRSIW